MAITRQISGQKSLIVFLKSALFGLTTLSVGFLFAVLFGYLFPLKVNIDYSKEVLDKDGKLMHAFLTSDDKWRLKTSISQADSEYIKMLIWKEDQYFFHHPGVNPFAIGRALFQNFTSGKRVSGASTITMQVARLLNKRPRSYASKIMEIWEAFRLEGCYNKNEILEIYMSICPFGGNIEGYRSATQIFWNSNGTQLSPSQCAALALIPNQPNRLHPVKNSLILTKSRNEFLKDYGYENPDFPLEEAMNEPLDAHYHPIPKDATQLAFRLLKKFPDQLLWKTTINTLWQKQVEKLSQTYVEKLKPYNIHNAAVLVVENSSGFVQVYMGSSSFSDNSHQGQIDGIKALRSPGSTLKPFLYAKMIEEGKLIPDQILYDVPMHFDGFAPLNADYLFHGKVSATNALIKSYNIPAVFLLNQFGTQEFINHLSLLGFKSLEDQRNKLGFSLILGGCGVSLEELVGAYCTLGARGLKKKLSFLENTKPNEGDRIYKESTTWLLADMLADWRRTFSSQTRNNEFANHSISWKTGTSFGKKDAWSIGFNKQYTVGVWLGNFNGSPSSALVGSDIASPIMLQIFNLLPNSLNKNVRPNAIKWQTLCEETGLMADTFCKKTKKGYWLSHSQTPKCRHKIMISTDLKNQKSYCAACKSDQSKYRQIWIENLDQAYLRFLQSRQIPTPEIPPHSQYCPKFGADLLSRINSPVEGKTYIIDGKNFNGIPLEIISSSLVKKVFWYLDQKLLYQGSPSQLFSINPEEGKHQISFVDDQGSTSSVSFFVKQIKE